MGHLAISNKYLRDLMYMYDLIDVKEYTDTEFDQDQGSSDCTNCPDNKS